MKTEWESGVRSYLRQINLPGHYFVHPTNTLAARSALTTWLVFVEADEASDRLDYVRLFVHHDNSCCAERALHPDEVIEVHEHGVTSAGGE